MIMKPYQNFVFDLYGTLVDIRTEEGQPSFWRSCSRYLGMQGVHYEPGVLRQKYEQGVKALEEQKRLELPQGAEPEIDIGAVFGALYRDAGMEADQRTIADFARTFRLLSLKRLKLFPGVVRLMPSMRMGSRCICSPMPKPCLPARSLRCWGLTASWTGASSPLRQGGRSPTPAFIS
jgi:putative hydrolase of the HAD superfamily